MATHDKKVLDLIAEVKKRKAEIGRLQKPTWKTNCVFPWIPTATDAASRINLHTCLAVDILLSIQAYLNNLADEFKKVANAAGIKAVFKWAGYTLEEWSEDIMTRINVLQLAEKKTKLAALEARLDKLVSPELRAELELEEITRELGS